MDMALCVLPSFKLAGNALRQRLKVVAIYDKNTQIWTIKSIGCDYYEDNYEPYPGQSICF